MTEEHQITPPPERVQQWAISSPIQHSDESWAYELFIAHQAARWGADQELEACCADLRMVLGPNQADWLHSVRRPKPPSLKELALQALYRFDDTEGHEGLTPEQIADDFVLIRRALESLPS